MSELTQINAKLKDGDRVVSVTYDFGQNLKEMTEKFGEQIVFTNAKGNMIITAQSRIRAAIKANKSDAEIQAIIDGWKPGTVSSPIADPVGSFEKFFASATPDKQKELLEALKKKLAGK